MNNKLIAMVTAGMIGLTMCFNSVLAAECIPVEQKLPEEVSLAKIRETWLGWNNTLREKSKLSSYVENETLDKTASFWSLNAVNKGAISHKRDGQKIYYDYPRMVKWFKGWGVEFKNISRATFTENIGWGYYKCPATGDCTDNMIKAIRTTYDFFVGEKGKKSRAHYESMMKKDFKKIGIGLALDQKKHKYFLTIHYGTEITSVPLPSCE